MNGIGLEELIVATVVATAVILAAGLVAAKVDDSPTPLGLTGLVASMTTALWWPSMHVTVSVAVVATAAALYIIGLRADESVDQRWHIAALVVGVLGRTIAFVAWFTSGYLAGPGGPRFLWLFAVVGVIAIVLWLRQWTNSRRRRRASTAPAAATPG